MGAHLCVGCIWVSACLQQPRHLGRIAHKCSLVQRLLRIAGWHGQPCREPAEHRWLSTTAARQERQGRRSGAAAGHLAASAGRRAERRAEHELLNRPKLPQGP